MRKVTVTGSNHGLMLELFLDQTNYMYNKLSRMAGARIDVHDPQYEIINKSVDHQTLYQHNSPSG